MKIEINKVVFCLLVFLTLWSSLLMAATDSDQLSVTLKVEEVCVARFMTNKIDSDSKFDNNTSGAGSVELGRQDDGSFKNDASSTLYASVRTNSAVEMSYKIYGTALTRYTTSSSEEGQSGTNEYHDETIPLTVEYTADDSANSSDSISFSNAFDPLTSNRENVLVLKYENQPAGMKNLNWKLDLSATPTTTQQTAGDYIAYLTLEVGPAQA